MGYFGYTMPVGRYSFYNEYSYNGYNNRSYSYYDYPAKLFSSNLYYPANSAYDYFQYSGNYCNSYRKNFGFQNSYNFGDYFYKNTYAPRSNDNYTNTTTRRNGTSRPKAGKKLGKEFLEAVKGVAKRVHCDYRDLLAVMNAESGLNPAAVNPNGGATGLIQFMPKTAKGYGTTTTKLKNMSAIEQLPYVEEFLKRCKKMAGFETGEYLSGGDLYALVFLPARAKRDILCTKGEAYYNWNSKTDLNKNGKIEKFELQQRIEKFRVDESIFV